MNPPSLAPTLKSAPQSRGKALGQANSGAWRGVVPAMIMAVSCFGPQALAGWVQPNIPGAVSGVTQYRIMFCTRNTAWAWTAGTTIATFNGYVQSAAASANAITYGLPQFTDGTTDGHLGGTALTWACLGATKDGQTALQNVAATLPDWNNYNYVYNTTGAQVTTPAIALFGGTGHLAGAQYAEDGYDNYGNNGNYRVATGALASSTTTGLGNASGVGRTTPTSVGTNNWFWQNNYGPTGCGLYALSGLITWYNTTPNLPAPTISLSTVNPLRLMLASTGTIAGEVANSATATADYNNAALSDASGQASNGLGISAWNPTGTFSVAIGASQPFTATLAAGWNLNGQNGGGFEKIYTVKVDDGAGSIATLSHIVDCLDNRKISADPFAVHAHAGFSSPVTLPVTLTGNILADNVTTRPTVAATTYTTPDTFVSVTGVAGTFSATSPTHTVSVTLNPGASSGTLNLALASGVGANIVRPEGLAGESINGQNYCPAGTANISVPSDHLDLAYTVYTGLGVWHTNGGGNWSSFPKWTTDGGVPGIDGTLSVNDTAIFGNALLSGSATVTVDVSPLIKSLTFDNTLGGTYLLAGANTLTLNSDITVSNGLHEISAPLQFNNEAMITTTNAPDRLTLSGTVAITGGLTKKGAGMLALILTNSYTGNTTVEDGVLSVTLPNFADTSTITIGTVPASPAVLNLPSSGTDTVAALIIDGGSPAATGKWGRLNSIAELGADFETDAITGDGLLDVLPGTATPYQTWIAGPSGYFQNETNEAIIGLDADPDGDGQSNAMEFALGGVPNSNSNNAKIFGLAADSNDADAIAEWLMTIAVRSGTPEFTDVAAPGATMDGVTYTVQGSTTLGSFTAPVQRLTVVVTPLAPNATPPAGYEYRTFRLVGSDGLPAKGFLRVEITH